MLGYVIAGRIKHRIKHQKHVGPSAVIFFMILIIFLTLTLLGFCLFGDIFPLSIFSEGPVGKGPGSDLGAHHTTSKRAW